MGDYWDLRNSGHLQNANLTTRTSIYAASKTSRSCIVELQIVHLSRAFKFKFEFLGTSGCAELQVLSKYWWNFAGV